MHKTSKEYKPLNLPLVTVPNYNLVWLYVTHWILFYFAWYSCLLELNMRRFLTRYTAFYVVITGASIFTLLALFHSAWWWILGVPFLALLVLGVFDISQTRHAIRRNYPVLGNLRFFFKFIRPEIRQYFFERDMQPLPVSRVASSLGYRSEERRVGKD